MVKMEVNFIRFKRDISQIKLPNRFTFPFDYIPHPIAISAAIQLQHYLDTQKEWSHDFGINPETDKSTMGKMFGVLVVKSQNGEIGFLQAFSGILAGKTKLPSFVPPIFDRQEPAFEYSQKEDEILVINQAMLAINKNQSFLDAKNNLNQFLSNEWEALKSQKTELKTAKKKRQKLRKESAYKLSKSEYANLVKEHEKESRQYDLKFKTKQKEVLLLKEELETQVNVYLDQIANYKKLRKAKSAETQQIIFDQYRFKNYEGNYKSVDQIFSEKKSITPPSGAGDCAAPKLFQYAFENEFTPIALAEFWWGKSPSLEIRQHEKFYPACKAKCHPILSFMLQGLELDPNPVTEIDFSSLKIETLFEDEFIVVVNKPANLLSVPGKEITDSVQTRMIEKYPNATGPLVVHRLDMATSGIMLIAKDLRTYHNLQQQFINRTIKKRYVAVLDGIPIQSSSAINLPLRVDLNNRPSQVVCQEHGKPAITNWEIIETHNGLTRVHLYPITGRTHQLRVHTSHPMGLKTPILGDELYGRRKDRLYLHANRLQFTHPNTSLKMIINCNADF